MKSALNIKVSSAALVLLWVGGCGGEETQQASTSDDIEFADVQANETSDMAPIFEQCQDAAIGSPCDDGNPCTVDDSCNADGGCVGESSRVCPDLDGNPCTDPVCDPEQVDGDPCMELPVVDASVEGPCYRYQCESGVAVSTEPVETNDCQSWVVPSDGCIDQYVCDSAYLAEDGSHCRPVGKVEGAPCRNPAGEGVVPASTAATVIMPSECGLYICYSGPSRDQAQTVPECVSTSELDESVREELRAEGIDTEYTCAVEDVPSFISQQCNEWRCGCSDDTCATAECLAEPKPAMQGVSCDDGNACSESVCMPSKSGLPILQCDVVDDVVEACDIFPSATCDVAGPCSPATGCPTEMDQVASNANCLSDNPCLDQVSTICDPTSADADPVTGCVTTYLAAGSSCLEGLGDACVTAASCSEQGADTICVPSAWLDCEDDNSCTSNGCSGGICYASPIEGDCSDNNECTQNDVCTEGVCTGTVIGCDNGLFCDGSESCDPAQGCISGSAIELADGISCTLDECDEATDTVIHTADDGACSDGVFCNGAETCNATSGCVSGAAPVVDDGVACTQDACDEVTNTVTHLPIDSDCDDGAFCNGAETCNAVSGCVSGAAPVVDDGVACTQDACDEATDMVLHLPDDTFCLANGLCQQATCNASLGCETQAVLNCCGNNQTEPGETCDDGNNTDGDGCSSTCQTEGEDCLEEGKWVGDVYWQKAEITANATCLGEYYTHSDALSACSALGPGWSLPTISMANALLASMSASEEDEWFPLSGNGGTSCQQMQAGGNGVWWLNEHNGQSGGAAIFCGSGGCYTTGTQMGDSYLYHVRCVKLGCTQGSTAPGCPGVCESAEEPVGPGTIYIADNGANAIWKYDLADEQKTLMLGNEQGWPHGITYNPTANTLYWSLTLGQSIRTYNLATGASTSFGTPGSHPSALSFDPVGQKLYWTETVGSALRRSAPDGSNIETLIDGLSFSVGLQVIPAEGKMYWSEESLNRIRRANLDGSNIENLIVTGAGKPRGIEVYGESIYWADRDSQTVRVRAKAGGGVITLASGFSFVQDVGIPEGGDTIYAIDDGISQPGVIYTIPINGGAKTPLPGLMGNPKHLVFVP